MELTVEGSTETLGEIAHIVSRSSDGPRGSSDLSAEERDAYENLILLCPTHHKMIDASADQWTCEKVRQMKQTHEKWVAAQLEKGAITVPPIDNSVFLRSRKEDWIAYAKGHVWAISSLTPISISEDAIDPLRGEFLQALNGLGLPEHVSSSTSINKLMTHPNEGGVVNEDLRSIQDGYGHRIQLFRNGHCEFSVCLEGTSCQATEIYKNGVPNEYQNTRLLSYTLIAESFACQIEGLIDMWNSGLPFNDMLLTTVITNTRDTCLDSGRQTHAWEPLVGSRAPSGLLEYNTVLTRGIKANLVLECVMKRFANYFGLVLDRLFDENGRFVNPRRLR
jgi:hypothetical protein